MGWNFWDDYNERNDGDCTCCPDSPNFEGKRDKAPKPKPPTECLDCGTSLAGQIKSFRKCDGCYQKGSAK